MASCCVIRFLCVFEGRYAEDNRWGIPPGSLEKQCEHAVPLDPEGWCKFMFAHVDGRWVCDCHEAQKASIRRLLQEQSFQEDPV